MATVVYVILLGALAVFAVGCAVRAVRYARLPLHLRWELYPVPHEEPHRARHGGSYFEEVDWWKTPRKFNLRGDLQYMVREILFLKGLREFNPGLWRRSFPFHLGLYLLATTAGLLVFTALLSFIFPGLTASPLGAALHWIYTLTGFSGLALAILGAAGLLIRRLTDRELRIYTTPGDLFNLCFFLAALGSLLAGYLLRGEDFPGVLAVARALLTLDPGVKIPGLLSAGLILSALLIAYIPFTHMTHFIGKFFTYHFVRWDDRPNRPGGKLERKLAEYLTYRPTWAGAHVGADGKKTWAQVATINPGRETKP